MIYDGEGAERELKPDTSLLMFQAGQGSFSVCHVKISVSSDLSASFPQGVRYIFIPANVRDYLLMSSAIRGVPVPSDHDKGDV